LHDIRGGAPFSTAVSHHPEVFDSLFVAALRTGERIGDLPGVLNRYQHDLKRRIALRRRVGQALAYPGFLLLTLTAVLGILFVFVLPRFVHMYADLGSELPWPTQLVVTLVENMPLLALTTLLIGGAMMGAYRAISRTAAGRARLEEWLYRAPVLGPVLQLSTQAQTARTLGTLIESGTTVVDALTAAQESSTSAAFAVRLDDARQEVANGGSLWRALLDSGVLPQSAAKMVEAGEASGNLHGALGGIAAYFEEKLEHSLARLMAVMEPALMLTMGVLVGGVIAVMYLPIFSMANVIQ
jgi:type IV pilus assembly protein PilC